jgi:hypothetical protein
MSTDTAMSYGFVQIDVTDVVDSGSQEERAYRASTLRSVCSAAF